MMPFAKDLQSLVIVTGASRGYGLQICLEILPYLSNNSNLVMLGRNEEQLALAFEQVNKLALNKSVHVKKVVADFTNLEKVSKFNDECLFGINISMFSNVFLFNNAGTLGDVSKTFEEMTDHKEVVNYFNINVSSCILFTSSLLTALKNDYKGEIFVINITSLLALKAEAGCSLYCTGKAARDMMFKVLAAERTDVRVVSWSPGPMPTDMGRQFLLNKNNDELVEAMEKMHKDDTIVPCTKSAKKLMELLQKNQFLSGSHIDYFDI